MSNPVVVIGAGGHARVVLATLQALEVDVAGIFDDDPATWGHKLQGRAIEGPVSEAEQYGREGILAIGSNSVRKRLSDSLDLHWVTAVHPSAWIDPSVEVGPGTVVFAGATLQAGTAIGAHVIINTGAVIDHDCRIRSFAHVAPAVALAGGVSVGEGALMGVGSCAVPGVSIGDWTVVGAGAAVVCDLEPNLTVVGVPARQMAGRSAK